ncbi:hypothetical protein ACFQE0_14545 [Methylobacterium komagatae]|uniref:Uncharacterized protein n=1 Tax=Methylobacterium komagatae TaxID=374425 RepID=A0ABW2BLH4_9HYPH
MPAPKRDGRPLALTGISADASRSKKGGRITAQLHGTDALAASQYSQGSNVNVPRPAYRQVYQGVRMDLTPDGLVQQAAHRTVFPVVHPDP